MFMQKMSRSWGERHQHRRGHLHQMQGGDSAPQLGGRGMGLAMWLWVHGQYGKGDLVTFPQSHKYLGS